MNQFAGTWIDQAEDTITVTAHGDHLSLIFSNGRGPFAGFSLNGCGVEQLASPVLSVDFFDFSPAAGVLSDDGSTIFWSNKTVWTKQ